MVKILTRVGHKSMCLCLQTELADSVVHPCLYGLYQKFLHTPSGHSEYADHTRVFNLSQALYSRLRVRDGSLSFVCLLGPWDLTALEHPMVANSSRSHSISIFIANLGH